MEMVQKGDIYVDEDGNENIVVEVLPSKGGYWPGVVKFVTPGGDGPLFSECWDDELDEMGLAPKYSEVVENWDADYQAP